MARPIIVFDLDDTLYSKVDQFYAIFTQFATSTLSKHELWHRYASYSDRAFELFQSGQLPLAESHFMRVDEFFNSLNQPLSATDVQTFSMAYKNQLQTISLDTKWQLCLQQLIKQNIQLALLTNGPSQHQRAKIQQLQLERFISSDYWFISEELSAAKPSQKAFRAVETAFSSPPSSFLMVGDSYTNDIEPALACGWSALWSWQYQQPVTPQRYDHRLYEPSDLWNFLKDSR